MAFSDSNSPAKSQDLDLNRIRSGNFPAGAAVSLKNAPVGRQRGAIAEIVCPQLAENNPVTAVALAEYCYAGNTNSMQNPPENLVQMWAPKDESVVYDSAIAQSPGGYAAVCWVAGLR